MPNPLARLQALLGPTAGGSRWQDAAKAVLSIAESLVVILHWLVLTALELLTSASNLASRLAVRPRQYLNWLLDRYFALSPSPYLLAFSLGLSCFVSYYIYRTLFVRKETRSEQYRRCLRECKADLISRMDTLNCHPLLLRLAWSEAGTYERSQNSWPECGGCTGQVRFDHELSHPNNAGLGNAIDFLRPLKKKYPVISWADLIQLAGATAVEALGGPQIDMLYGRIDAKMPQKMGSLTSRRGGVAISADSDSSSSDDEDRYVTPSSAPAPASTAAASSSNNNSNNTNSNNSNSTNSSGKQQNSNSVKLPSPGQKGTSLRTPPTSASSGNSNSNNSNSNTNASPNSSAPNGNNVASSSVKPPQPHPPVLSSQDLYSRCLAARLPSAVPLYPDGAPTADVHLRNCCYRMGLNNRDIVALLGAHTIGRAFGDRSGVCPHKSGDQDSTKYTRISSIPKGKPATYLTGGCSWTKNWLQFDNAYFRRLLLRDGRATDKLFSVTVENPRERPMGIRGQLFPEGDNGDDDTNATKNDDSNINVVAKQSETDAKAAETNTANSSPENGDEGPDDPDLLWLPLDQCLLDCPDFRRYVYLYGNDQAAWFKDYARSHKKMSELGSRFDPPGGIAFSAQ